MTLKWVDNSINNTGFTLQRATNSTFTTGLTTVATLGPNVTTYIDTTVLPTTTYHYRVQAFDWVGASTWSTTANVTTLGQLPLAPTGLAVSGTTRTSISLTWTDNATNETNYRVQRSNNGTTLWTTVANGLPANTTGYTAAVTTPNTTRFFRVQAYNASGASAWSNVTSGTTLP